MSSLFCSYNSLLCFIPTRTAITSPRCDAWIGSTARSNRFKSSRNSLNSRSMNFWRSLQFGIEITSTSLKSIVYGFSTVPSPLISSISGKCGDPSHQPALSALSYPQSVLREATSFPDTADRCTRPSTDRRTRISPIPEAPVREDRVGRSDFRRRYSSRRPTRGCGEADNAHRKRSGGIRDRSE